MVKKLVIGFLDFEVIFDEIVEVFVFFDCNKDGYVSKKEMIWVINEVLLFGWYGYRIGV